VSVVILSAQVTAADTVDAGQQATCFP